MITRLPWPRSLLSALGVAVLLAACSGEPVAPDEDVTPRSELDEDTEHGLGDDTEIGAESGVEPVVEGELPDAPGAPEPVRLSDDEVLPNAKKLASDIVQQLTTYDPDDTAEDIAGRVVGNEDIDALLTAISPLYHDGAWSRGEIVYPQLGGATSTDTSVMVVVRQRVGLPSGTVHEVTRTVDVRLRLVDGQWAFNKIPDAGGEPVARPEQLPAEAVAVLDDDRIELPDSAKWDIHAGRTRSSLLEVMSALADRHPYAVAVLETGHPVHIFDTERISTHIYGIAVDIYSIDGVLVVEDRDEGSRTHDTAEWLYDRSGVTNLGAPWALDGFGGRSFTDLVHQDHFHVEAGPRPDGPPAHRPELEVADEDT